MKVSKIRKLSIPILFSFISIIYLYGIDLIDSGYDEGIFGAKFLPVISVSFIFILIIIDVIKSIKEKTDFEIKKINFKPVTIFSISTVIYLILFNYLGYLVSTPLYVISVYVCFSDEKISIYKAVLTSIILTAVFYFLFSVIFNVRLPVLLGG